MTGVTIRKVTVKVRLIAPDVVIRNVSHGRLVLLRTQNALIAIRLDILQKFASLQIKAVLQKMRKAEGEERETAHLLQVLMLGVDVLKLLRETIKFCY